MKKCSILPVLALLSLATMPLADGQNLPASMAFPDDTTCGNLQFLDVSITALDESPSHQIMAESTNVVLAGNGDIAHSSAAVLSALGLLCLARRMR